MKLPQGDGPSIRLCQREPGDGQPFPNPVMEGLPTTQTEPVPVSAVGTVFPKLRDAGLWSPRPLRRPDAVELKRTDQAACPVGFLIQAYCVFSGDGATCEAAAPPAGGMVSGSAKNLPTICATSGELMKL